MRRALGALKTWPYTFAVIVSLTIGITAIVASQRLGIGLKDPEGFLGPAYVRLPLIGLAFFAIGVVPQAIMRTGVRPISNLKSLPSAMRGIVRDEWTWGRVGYIATGLLAFYACYVSYRNLKSYLPEIRTGADGQPLLYDSDLLRFDHWLMFGNNPAPLLHDLLGTNVAAQFLAAAYVFYLPLIPLTLGALLVWNRDVSLGAWYATALSLNWVLGTISYYIIPTLGPGFAQPSMFADLPENPATTLQNALFRGGSQFKEDPSGDHIYGIAGFASLHVSVVVTACLFFERTGQKLLIRAIAWAFLVITILATIYFGWHYIVDDVAGVLIGWTAVSLGAWATGNRGRRRNKNAQPMATVSAT